LLLEMSPWNMMNLLRNQAQGVQACAWPGDPEIR